MTDLILQIILLYALLIRSAATTQVSISTSVVTTVHRNGNPFSTLTPGHHVVTLNLQTHDVLALTLDALSTGTGETRRITVTAATQPELSWRFTADNADAPGPQWRARHWLPACLWRQPRVNGNTATLIAADTGAISTTTTIRLRAVVGDPCPQPSTGARSPSTQVPELTIPTQHAVRLAVGANAHTRAWVFVDGRHVADVTPNTAWMHSFPNVPSGAVVAIKAVAQPGFRGAVAVNAGVDGMAYATGPLLPASGWRVGVAEAADAAAVLKSGFNDCGWTAGKLGPAPATSTVGARYVWIANASPTDIIVARFVVPNDSMHHCPTQQHTATTTNALASSTCAYEQKESAHSTASRSDCHYLTDGSRRTCRSRQCEPTYAYPGRATGLICVRRQTTERIVPISGPAGGCKTVPDRREMYVPYQPAS